MLPRQSQLSRLWPAILGLFSALSLAGLVALARLPADPEKALALGFSASRLALMEDAKLLPAGAVWDYYCSTNNVPFDTEWIAEVKQYEKDVLSKR